MLAKLAATWWRVCVRPHSSVFAGERAGKNNWMTFAGVLIAALTGILLSWAAHWLIRHPPDTFMGLAGMWLKAGTPAPFLSWEILVPAGVVLGFYDFEVVLFIFAKLLGGKGSFGEQAYAQSLFYAPLAIVQQLVAVLPVAARIAFAVFAVWSLWPTTTSLRAAHRYSMTRAVLTWVAPIVLNVIVVAAVIAVAQRGRI